MTPLTPARRREQLYLGLLLALSLALRLYRLGQANLWWDEALAIWAVRKGLLGVTAWTAGDVHPPLYFWGLWAWVQLFGESPFAMRSLSAVIGTLTVWAAHGLGRQMGGHRVGLLAGALTAVAPFAVWWSQEMRMYALAGLLCTISWLQMLRWFNSERLATKPDLRALALSALASLGALYTIFLSAAALLAQAGLLLLYWLATGPRKQFSVLLRWAIAQLGVLALLAPWLLYSWERMPTWSVAEAVSPVFVARLFATLVVTGRSVDIDAALPGTLAALLLLTGAVVLRVWRRHEIPEDVQVADGWGTAAMVLAAVVPLLFIYVSTLPRGLFYTPHVEARYFYPFAPPCWVLLAWAAIEFGRRSRWLGWGLAAGLLALSLSYLPEYYRGRLLYDDLQSMVRTISAYAEPGDAVCLISGDRYPIWDYYYHDPEREGLRPTVYYLPQGTSAITAENVAAQLAPLTAQHRRIWLAYFESALQDPQALAQGWLRERNNELYAARFDHNSLWLYAAEGPLRVAEPAFPQHVPALGLPPQPNLVGYDLPTAEFRPGDTVRLALYWEPAAAAQVAVSLRDGQGRVLEARDLALDTAAGLTRTEAAFPIYPGTPAGAYHFQVDIRAGEQGTSSLQLGALRVTHTTPPPRPPQMAQPVGADLGGVARLEGYTLRVQGQRAPAAAIHAGDTLELTLYWRAPAKIEARYTVFTHLLGAAYNPATSGPVWAQHDAEPQDGGLPTTQWFPGEMVPDRHLLAIDAQAPAGGYELEVGLYDTMTGARLPVAAANGQAAGDRVLLGTWTVQERKR